MPETEAQLVQAVDTAGSGYLCLHSQAGHLDVRHEKGPTGTRQQCFDKGHLTNYECHSMQFVGCNQLNTKYRICKGMHMDSVNYRH